MFIRPAKAMPGLHMAQDQNVHSTKPRKYSIHSGIPNSIITYLLYFFEHFTLEEE